MIKTKELSDALKLAGLRKDYLANQLGISKQSLSNKINNKTEFKFEEANYIRELIGLTDEKFLDIFFGKIVIDNHKSKNVGCQLEKSFQTT